MVDKNVEPITPKSLKIDIEEDFISFKFGETDEVEEKFVVLSEIRIKPTALYPMLVELFKVGRSYEKIYKQDIGFSEDLENEQRDEYEK